MPKASNTNYDNLSNHRWARAALSLFVIIAVTFLLLATIGWLVRLDGPAVVAATLVIVTLFAATFIVLWRQYHAGYDAFWAGVHFERTWSRAKTMGWADAMMDSDDGEGPQR